MFKKIGAFAATMFASASAFAASEIGTTAFQSLFEMLEAWATGYLGKSIALTFLLVGLCVGVLRGSIMGAIACIACAMALLVGPDIVVAILDSATV